MIISSRILQTQSAYPIVKIKTSDGLTLHGMIFEANKKDSIVINIHGTASCFYDENFISNMAIEYPNNNISFLSTNNRGNAVLQAYSVCGAGWEKFEDCLIDIDGWVKFAADTGYEKIILQGHSLGTEKIVYYMTHGKYKNRVSSVILLGFSDSYGDRLKYLKKAHKKDQMPEAISLIKDGKGEQFITGDWLCHAGVLPQSADSYHDFFKENSELSRALPLRNGKNLENYRKIKVPILAIIGDGEEFTIIPIKNAMELLKNENENSIVHQIKNCDHDFDGKESELTDIILNFLNT